MTSVVKLLTFGKERSKFKLESCPNADLSMLLSKYTNRSSLSKQMWGGSRFRAVFLLDCKLPHQQHSGNINANLSNTMCGARYCGTVVKHTGMEIVS